ncbi:MAG: thioredoxin family protein [Chitinophagaceae bacterium]
MYKSISILLIGLLLTQFSFSQVRQVKFEHLDSLQKLQNRPVLVFLHTSWCKYCGTMKNSTFKNKDVQDLINKQFYFVALDVEERNNIIFRGYSFKYKPTGTTTGVHELAEQLGTINGELAYPGLCFLSPLSEIIYQREGYVQAKELLVILKKLK